MIPVVRGKLSRCGATGDSWGTTGLMETERASPRYSDIDVWEPSDILDAMIEGQFTAVAAVRSARPAIERAARAMEARLKQGGRLIYAGAGTSGRLAKLVRHPNFGFGLDRIHGRIPVRDV